VTYHGFYFVGIVRSWWSRPCFLVVCRRDWGWWWGKVRAQKVVKFWSSKDVIPRSFVQPMRLDLEVGLVW